MCNIIIYSQQSARDFIYRIIHWENCRIVANLPVYFQASISVRLTKEINFPSNTISQRGARVESATSDPEMVIGIESCCGFPFRRVIWFQVVTFLRRTIWIRQCNRKDKGVLIVLYVIKIYLSSKVRKLFRRHLLLLTNVCNVSKYFQPSIEKILTLNGTINDIENFKDDLNVQKWRK